MIAGEYADAGKSGKSIEGRIYLIRMIDDIKTSNGISFIFVFKLSRFGCNAADVLSTLRFGVNLICVEDGIDPQKINTQVDTTELEQEIANYEKQPRQSYSAKRN